MDTLAGTVCPLSFSPGLFWYTQQQRGSRVGEAAADERARTVAKVLPRGWAVVVVGDSRVRSSMIILKKLGLLVCFDSSWTAASRVAKLVRRTSAFLISC